MLTATSSSPQWSRPSDSAILLGARDLMKTGQSPLGDLRPPTMLKPRDVPGGRLRWMMWHSAPLGSVLLLNEVREGGREGEREKGR